jgi:hypothetical protein
METTGLALEYQGNYGTARADLDILDLINNPSANGLCRLVVLQPEDVTPAELRALLDDLAES